MRCCLLAAIASVVLLVVVLKVELFHCRGACTTVILRAATALLVTKILAGIGCEKTFNEISMPVNGKKCDSQARTNMLRVLAAPLHLGLVVGAGERFLLTGKLWMRTIGGVIQLLMSA